MSVSHDANGSPPNTHSPTSAVAPPSGSSISNLLGGTPPPSRPQSLYSASMGADAVLANGHGDGDPGNPAGPKQIDSARDSIEGDEPPHVRSASNSSGLQRHQMSPQSSPYYNGRNTQSFHMPLGQQRRSSATGPGDDSTPPAIRYTQSEAHSHTNRGSFSSSSTNGAGQTLGNTPAHGSTGGPDEGKNIYQLWLPWEETALVDWLYEPTNCKLFNEPRRKKECHERIIREILSGKTSRSIEGKIRTLEKRYLKASTEIQRPDFGILHPGKQPLDVAEALCINFHKLETIFKSGLAQQASSQQQSTSQQQAPLQQASLQQQALLQQHLPSQQGPSQQGPSQQPPQKKTWVAGSPASESGGPSQRHLSGSPFEQRNGSPSNGPRPSAAAGSTSLAGVGSISTTSMGSNGGGSSTHSISIPQASPPRISTAETMPYRTAGQSCKLAPKRGLDGSLLPDGGSGSGADADGPLMMSSSKRSRTFPAILQTQQSPARNLQAVDPRVTVADVQQQQLQQALASQRSPMAMQMPISSAYPHHQQQQLYYQRQAEYPRHIHHHYPMDAGVPGSARSVAAVAGGVQPLSSTQSQMSNGVGGSAAGLPISAQGPLSSGTPSGANMAMPSIRETMDGPGGGHNSAAILGTREELEWLQFNLRREELEFRKTVFVHEQDLESKRMRIEESRLEVQKREMDVEAKRIEMQTKQVELQMDSLRSLSGMLSQMVTQMSSLVASKSSSKSRRRDSADSNE